MASPKSRDPSDGEVVHVAEDLRVVLGQLMRRLRAQYRFSLSQATVLGRLDREGPMTTSALAGAEHVKPQSMARTVGELEADGMVSRAADPADGRQWLVDLTEAGRAALAQERARREGWLAQAIATGLDSHEQDVLAESVALLRRLTQM